MSKNRKKPLIIAGIATVLVVGAASVGLVAQNLVGDVQPTPTPTATATSEPPKPFPTATDGVGVDLSSVSSTEQYIAGQSSLLGEYAATSDIGGLDSAYYALAMNTIDRYVEASVANPYFVSGFWEKEDSFRKDSLQTYITPLMAEEKAIEFLEPAADPEAENFNTYYSQLLHLPSEGMEPSPYCQETFSEESCFYFPYEYTAFELKSVEGVDNQVAGSVTVKVLPIYQKPDADEGNTVYEERTYTFDFVLQLDDEPNEGKLDGKPVLEIVDLSGSLVIGQVTDYLVMQVDTEA